MKIKIRELLKKYLGVTMIASSIVGALISWGISWVLPSPDVNINNIPQKELTCTLDYSYPMLITKSSDSRLQILYDGKSVKSPFVFGITISNTGKYAVTNEDFKDKFSIDFSGSKQVINAQIVKSTNKTIYDEVLNNTDLNGTKLTITDFYLNTGEFFSIYVITDGKPDGIHYSSRISGISELTYRNTQKEKQDSIVYLAILVLGIILLIAITLIAYAYWQNKKFNQKYANMLQALKKYNSNQK